MSAKTFNFFRGMNKDRTMIDLSDYSSPQAARVLMVAFWLSPYTAGALEESSLPEHRHFAPKTILGTAVLADAFHVSFNMRKA